ncbi:MAG: 4-hydroxythreonine-4-phosphate dehydrogenase PdxA [Bacteroidota bacterium]
MSKLPIIGITLGDVNGISVEVIIKTLLDNRVADYCTPIVYGNPKIISYWKKLMGQNDYNMHIIKNIDQHHVKKANILVCWDDEVEIRPGESTELAGKYAFRSLEMATKDAKEGKIQAIVTGPLNKHNVNNQLLPFKGHTEYLAQQAGTNDYLMMMVSGELKVGLVTGHLPLKDVSARLSSELILKKLRLLNKSLKEDFSIQKPKIAVLGLNPHAGEEGLLGNEEKDIIIPAVTEAQKDGMVVYGPFSADGFFGIRQHEKYDAVLAMYHDQGLIPFKYLAFENGVNYTAGLPFVRTSPDHGTAYNIAGKNVAKEDSFRSALYAAIDIVRTRNTNFKLNENPLPFSPFKKERFRIDF